MAELGVKIVEMEDGTILRLEPGTPTGDLKVISEGVEEEPKVVKTSPERELKPAAPAAKKHEPAKKAPEAKK